MTQELEVGRAVQVRGGFHPEFIGILEAIGPDGWYKIRRLYTADRYTIESQYVHPVPSERRFIGATE